MVHVRSPSRASRSPPRHRDTGEPVHAAHGALGLLGARTPTDTSSRTPRGTNHASPVRESSSRSPSRVNQSSALSRKTATRSVAASPGLHTEREGRHASARLFADHEHRRALDGRRHDAVAGQVRRHTASRMFTPRSAEIQRRRGRPVCALWMMGSSRSRRLRAHGELPEGARKRKLPRSATEGVTPSKIVTSKPALGSPALSRRPA